MTTLDRLARDLPEGSSVVVVDSSPVRRQALADRLRRRGILPLEVPAPLDAILTLDHARPSVQAVIVGPSAPPELAPFVQESYPSVRVISL